LATLLCASTEKGNELQVREEMNLYFPTRNISSGGGRLFWVAVENIGKEGREKVKEKEGVEKTFPRKHE